MRDSDVFDRRRNSVTGSGRAQVEQMKVSVQSVVVISGLVCVPQRKTRLNAFACFRTASSCTFLDYGILCDRCARGQDHKRRGEPTIGEAGPSDVMTHRERLAMHGREIDVAEVPQPDRISSEGGFPGSKPDSPTRCWVELFTFPEQLPSPARFGKG